MYRISFNDYYSVNSTWLLFLNFYKSSYATYKVKYLYKSLEHNWYILQHFYFDIARLLFIATFEFAIQWIQCYQKYHLFHTPFTPFTPFSSWYSEWWTLSFLLGSRLFSTLLLTRIRKNQNSPKIIWCENNYMIEWILLQWTTLVQDSQTFGIIIYLYHMSKKFRCSQQFSRIFIIYFLWLLQMWRWK